MRSEDENRGFWLGLPRQRQGLNSEACEILTDFWFNDLAFSALRQHKAISNVASRHFPEKPGMPALGTAKRDYVAGRFPAEIPNQKIRKSKACGCSIQFIVRDVTRASLFRHCVIFRERWSGNVIPANQFGGFRNDPDQTRPGSGGLVSSVKVFIVCLAILLSAGVVAADNPAHQKGTLTVATSSGHKSYNLNAGRTIYLIGNCGDFQNGQEVEFFVKEDRIYIAHEGAKDYKCSIESTTESIDPNTQPTPNDMSTPIYVKGTILGFSIRRDVHVSGGGGSPGGAGFPVGSSTRKAKVYELQGPDLIYEVDYCGAFQAGEFAPGQVVEFRADIGGGRLYIRHDGNKEYGCQLEGTTQAGYTAWRSRPIGRCFPRICSFRCRSFHRAACHRLGSGWSRHRNRWKLFGQHTVRSGSARGRAFRRREEVGLQELGAQDEGSRWKQHSPERRDGEIHKSLDRHWCHYAYSTISATRDVS